MEFYRNYNKGQHMIMRLPLPRGTMTLYEILMGEAEFNRGASCSPLHQAAGVADDHFNGAENAEQLSNATATAGVADDHFNGAENAEELSNATATAGVADDHFNGAENAEELSNATATAGVAYDHFNGAENAKELSNATATAGVAYDHFNGAENAKELPNATATAGVADDHFNSAENAEELSNATATAGVADDHFNSAENAEELSNATATAGVEDTAEGTSSSSSSSSARAGRVSFLDLEPIDPHNSWCCGQLVTTYCKICTRCRRPLWGLVCDKCGDGIDNIYSVPCLLFNEEFPETERCTDECCRCLPMVNILGKPMYGFPHFNCTFCGKVGHFFEFCPTRLAMTPPMDITGDEALPCSSGRVTAPRTLIAPPPQKLGTSRCRHHIPPSLTDFYRSPEGETCLRNLAKTTGVELLDSFADNSSPLIINARGSRSRIRMFRRLLGYQNAMMEAQSAGDENGE